MIENFICLKTNYGGILADFSLFYLKQLLLKPESIVKRPTFMKGSLVKQGGGKGKPSGHHIEVSKNQILVQMKNTEKNRKQLELASKFMKLQNIRSRSLVKKHFSVVVYRA